MIQKTTLYDLHEEYGAKIVDFAGWRMPIHYGSQLQEHRQVRQQAGMFDVSHMTVVDIHGDQAETFLRMLLANDVARLNPHQALYGCMLNEAGGILDDLIVYRLDGWFRVVVNAATRDKDLAWMRTHAEKFSLQLTHREDLSMIAVQGPRARELSHQALSKDTPTEAAQSLKRFYAADLAPWFVARTGYTGEDGYEIIAPHEQIRRLWQSLHHLGVKPVGLGARDSLRLEAGMHLYGQDMNEKTTPLECGLGWTVAWEGRDFMGKTALEQQKAAGVPQKQVGLILLDKGVLRHEQTLWLDDNPCGIITSGGFSPVLNKSIALALVPPTVQDRCQVQIRDKRLDTRVVKPPFVRNGNIQVSLD